MQKSEKLHEKGPAIQIFGVWWKAGIQIKRKRDKWKTAMISCGLQINEDERTARQETGIFFEIWSLFLQVFDPVLIDMQL